MAPAGSWRGVWSCKGASKTSGSAGEWPRGPQGPRGERPSTVALTGHRLQAPSRPAVLRSRSRHCPTCPGKRPSPELDRPPTPASPRFVHAPGASVQPAAAAAMVTALTATCLRQAAAAAPAERRQQRAVAPAVAAGRAGALSHASRPWPQWNALFVTSSWLDAQVRQHQTALPVVLAACRPCAACEPVRLAAAPGPRLLLLLLLLGALGAAWTLPAS